MCNQTLAFRLIEFSTCNKPSYVSVKYKTVPDLNELQIGPNRISTLPT